MDEPSPIPEEFHSVETGAPFAHCIDCGEDLTRVFSYAVQKVIRRGETVFEFALCEACRERLMQGFSEDTRQRLQEHFETHLAADHGPRRCALTGIPRDECDEFELGGQFSGTHLLFAIMISETAREKLQELISDQTRGHWDEFVGRHFPGVSDDQPAPMIL